MTFQQRIDLHNIVVHEGLGHKGRCVGVDREYPKKDMQGGFDKSCPVRLEERFIYNLSYNTLQSVCNRCFGLGE